MDITTRPEPRQRWAALCNGVSGDSLVLGILYEPVTDALDATHAPFGVIAGIKQM